MQQGIDALLQAGFARDQISFAGHGTPHGLLANIRSLFKGETMSRGRVHDDLMEDGLPEQAATYYQREYDAGRSIIEVAGTSDLGSATSILSRYGGYGARPGQTAESMTAQQAEQTSARQAAQAPAQQPAPGAEGEQHMRLHEEQLQIFRRNVQAGEVRLHKEVVSEQKSIDVPVTHEEVYIERRPDSGQPSDTPIDEGETYSIPVNEEQISVTKQPVETGEVVLGKRQVQDTQHISETVRSEKPRLEHEGDVTFRDQDKDRDQEP